MKDLFGDELPAQKSKPNQTVYYLSISSIQKCIRRGETERAVNFAKVAYRQNGYRTFCRLWTILFEDCGTSLDALQAFRNYPLGSRNFSDLVPLITAMSESVKDYRPVYLSDVIKGASWGQGFPPVALYQALKGTPFSLAIEWYKEYPERELEVFDLLDYDAEDAWIPKLCKLGCKFDYSKFSLGVPLLIHEDGVDDPTTTLEDTTELTLYRDFLPLESVDTHTRQGKFAQNIFLKNNSNSWLDKNSIGGSVFFHEGVIHSKSKVGAFDLRKLLWDILSKNPKTSFLDTIYTEETKLFWSEKLSDLNSLRSWVLDKHFNDDVNYLQSEYEKDFIDVKVEEKEREPEPSSSRG
jgi:hypothetical protein